MIMSDLEKLRDEDLFLEPQAGSGALLDYLQNTQANSYTPTIMHP
jgi:hypothetical protein